MDSGQDHPHADRRLPGSAINALAVLALLIGVVWWTTNPPAEGAAGLPGTSAGVAGHGTGLAGHGTGLAGHGAGVAGHGTGMAGAAPWWGSGGDPVAPRMVEPPVPAEQPSARSFAVIDSADGAIAVVLDQAAAEKLLPPTDDLVFRHGGFVTADQELQFEGPAPSGSRLLLQVACLGGPEIEVAVEVPQASHGSGHSCDSGYSNIGPFTTDAGRAEIRISTPGDGLAVAVFQLLRQH